MDGEKSQIALAHMFVLEETLVEDAGKHFWRTKAGDTTLEVEEATMPSSEALIETMRARDYVPVVFSFGRPGGNGVNARLKFLHGSKIVADNPKLLPATNELITAHFATKEILFSALEALLA